MKKEMEVDAPEQTATRLPPPNLRHRGREADYTVPVRPWHVLVLITISVYIVEMSIMGFIYFVAPFSDLGHAFFDSSVLTAFLFPMIFLFMYRPLVREIHERRSAEEAVRVANETLEERVQERTAALQSMNTALQQEVETRIRAEADLKESEERYRLLIETMNEGLEVLDPDGIITYVNKRLCDMLGYTREEMIGRRMGEFFEPAERDFFDQHLGGLQECALGHHEITWIRKDGGKVYSIFSPRLLFDDQSRFRGCFAVVTDITDRKGIENALKESESRLRVLSSHVITAQEEERKRIARELHDQLGQDLASLKLQVRSVQRNLSPADGELIGKCEEILAYVDTVIENVRRLYMDLTPVALEDFGFADAIRWMVDSFCRHHGLEQKVEVEEVGHLFSSQAQMTAYRIVQEALNNVAKHAKARSVQILAAKRGFNVEIQVQDDGEGFEREAVRERGRKGEGLGLSFMDERAWMLGGKLSVDTEVGKGTRVTLTVPISGGGRKE
jgi:PAS domain S-box-containing protein